MSQTPLEADDKSRSAVADDPYQQNWAAMEKMLLDGHSLSGSERNCVFLNTGGERFANVSAISGLDFADDGRGLAKVDWDHDGDLDLWLSNRTAPRVRFLRNNTDQGHHFLAVKLVGKHCNRDAIGARVEVYLSGQEQPLIKTLRAGEGYLSQSSKWLHFGLGNSPTVEKLLVRWPGGKPETIANLDVDQHYTVTQNEGRAQQWQRPTGALNLAASRVKPASESAQAAVLLSWRLPLPEMRYETFDGERANVLGEDRRPVLINLWASWCLPCLKELAEFAENEDPFKASGVRVVALSVDGLGDKSRSDRAAGKRLAASHDWPFASGWATTETVDKLQLMHDQLFLWTNNLPVPASFLIDAQGRLAAVYRGPVSAERVLADVQTLALEGEALRDRALPFVGRWFEPPSHRPWVPAALALFRRGYADDGLKYVAQHQSRLAQDESYPKLVAVVGQELMRRGDLQSAHQHFLEVVRLEPKNAAALRNLGVAQERLGQLAEAEASYRQGLELNPGSAGLHRNLGALLSRLKRYDEAMAELQVAIRLNPKLALAHRSLAVLYVRRGQVEDAIARFRVAISLEPAHAASYYNLATLLSGTGETAEAIAQLREALKLSPEMLQARYRLGSLLEQQGELTEAITEYRLILKTSPQEPLPKSKLAFILATAPDEKLRDVGEALRLAQSAAEATRRQVAEVMDSLAAAQSAHGDFEAAAKTASQAARLAESAGNEALAAQITARVKLYQAGQSYRMPQR